MLYRYTRVYQRDLGTFDGVFQVLSQKNVVLCAPVVVRVGTCIGVHRYLYKARYYVCSTRTCVYTHVDCFVGAAVAAS